MIARRMQRLWLAVVGSGVTDLEVRNADAMLDLERETLREQVARYNEGLAGYAGLIERLKHEREQLEKERSAHEPRLRARLLAQDRDAAGRHALRLETIAERLTVLETELDRAEQEYRELARARDAAVARARERIEAFKRSLGDLRLKEALASVSELGAGLHGATGLGDGTLERIQERIDDKRHHAAGRARVARDAVLGSEGHTERVEYEARAQAALARYEASTE